MVCAVQNWEKVWCLVSVVEGRRSEEQLQECAQHIGQQVDPTSAVFHHSLEQYPRPLRVSAAKQDTVHSADDAHLSD